MHNTTGQRLLGALLVSVMLAIAASAQASDLKLDFDDEEISIAISKAAVRGFVDGLFGQSLQCDGDLDDPMRSLLEQLEREGPRARASIRDGNALIEAHRRGKSVRFTIRDEGTGRIRLDVPWKLARCLLGDDLTIDRATASRIKVKVVTDEGKSFSFSMQ
jgi:hypothetical protein